MRPAAFEGGRLLEQQGGDRGPRSGATPSKKKRVAEGHDMACGRISPRSPRPPCAPRSPGSVDAERARYVVSRFDRWRGSPPRGARRLRQHVGMELLALGQEGLQQRDADAPPRLRIMLNSAEAEPAFSASMPAVATAESGAKYERLADGTHDVGPEAADRPRNRCVISMFMKLEAANRAKPTPIDVAARRSAASAAAPAGSAQAAAARSRPAPCRSVRNCSPECARDRPAG